MKQAIMVVILSILILSSAINAQWEVKIIKPSGATSAQITSLDTTQQGGTATINGSGHAVMWENEQFTDLHPDNTSFSIVYAVRDGKQVGYGLNTNIGHSHAFLWNGTKASLIDLHPSSSPHSSSARACFGNMQGGEVGAHASIWYGTAESWVDLNPEGYLYSDIWGMDEKEQVGHATKGVLAEACLWRGTKESVVILNPSTSGSLAYGVSNGKQVGMVSKDHILHATIWSGTAESWKSLNPPGTRSAYAICISGDYQAGYAGEYGYEHAALWKGTPESYFDLQTLLPEGVYTSTKARDIEVVGEEIWIGGDGRNSLLQTGDAIIWHYKDITAPTVVIDSPTTEPEYGTTKVTIDLAGTATDNVAVTEVLWTNSRGGRGVCVGTTNWSVSNIPLQVGVNLITISASDNVGNISVATIAATMIDTSAVKWRGTIMVSCPIIPASTNPKPVIGFSGNYWYEYRPELGNYACYPDRYTWFDPVERTPGRGFWAKFDAETKVPTGLLPSQTKPVIIHLLPGWNLIGQPFIKPLTWNSKKIQIQVAGEEPKRLVDSGDAVSNYAWGWRLRSKYSNIGAYYLISDPIYRPRVSGVLQPWQAYWVMAYKDCNLILPPPE